MPLPLIPIAIAGAIAGANRLRQKKLNISVIGPAAAGKTVLIDILKNGKVPECDEYQGTVGISKMKEFVAYWTKENKIKKTIITINSLKKSESPGNDVAGDLAYVDTYEELATKRDAVFFVFDVSKYLGDRDYEKIVKAELMFIYNKTNKGKDIRLIMLGSHADVAKTKLNLATEKAVSDKFLTSLNGKEYRTMSVENIRFLNFLDQTSVEEIRKSLGSLGE